VVVGVAVAATAAAGPRASLAADDKKEPAAKGNGGRAASAVETGPGGAGLDLNEKCGPETGPGCGVLAAMVDPN
jgi:hypothetical protein